MALAVKRYGFLAKFVTTFRLAHRGKIPWEQHYRNSKARCENPKEPKYKYYGGRGIRHFLTRADIHALYVRDKAWLMKIPSLDRIDGDGNYTVKNCRFIEFSLNRVMRKTSIAYSSKRLAKRRG